MTNRDDPGDGPMFTATKDGVNLHFSRDPHPGIDGYLVVEGLGLLVLFPNDRGDSELPNVLPEIEAPDRSDHDAQLRDAFQILGPRVPPSIWSCSSKPQSELLAGFRALEAQPFVRHDVAVYLASAAQ